MSVDEKKKRFFALVLSPTQKVYKELHLKYKEISENLNEEEYQEEISRLKQIYKVKTNKQLLLALKPHPISIALAQAAVESAWATSRFSVEANNLFGMWSDKKNQERIAAKVQRNGNRTVWLRKFSSFEASIRAYYLTLGRARAYALFREYRYETNNVFEIIKGLYNYSELGEAYVAIIKNIIIHDNLTEYDNCCKK